MLRATYSVLKRGASNCFYVITNAEDLTDVDRGRLLDRNGNEHVESPAPYDVLMRKVGFVNIQLTNVTSAYIETLKEWKQAWEADAPGLIDLVGEEDYSLRMHNRTLDIANAEDGIVRRYQVYGTKP